VSCERGYRRNERISETLNYFRSTASLRLCSTPLFLLLSSGFHSPLLTIGIRFVRSSTSICQRHASRFQTHPQRIQPAVRRAEHSLGPALRHIRQCIAHRHRRQLGRVLRRRRAILHGAIRNRRRLGWVLR
jgi:hypothetical protein